MTNYDAQKFGIEIEVIASSLVATLKQKNADYGNNVDKNIDEWGLSSLAIRLDDKLSRFKNLIKEGQTRQVSDETIEDTLLDLAGYAILGYRKIQEINVEKIVDTWNSLDSGRTFTGDSIDCNSVEVLIKQPEKTVFSFNS